MSFQLVLLVHRSSCDVYSIELKPTQFVIPDLIRDLLNPISGAPEIPGQARDDNDGETFQPKKRTFDEHFSRPYLHSMTQPDFKSLAARAEAISLRYAERNGFTRDDAWFMLKLQEEMGEVTQAFVKASGRGRTHGKSDAELKQDLADEVADLFGHLLLFCQHNDIDLAKAFEEKWLVHEAGLSPLDVILGGVADRGSRCGKTFDPNIEIPGSTLRAARG